MLRPKHTWLGKPEIVGSVHRDRRTLLLRNHGSRFYFHDPIISPHQIFSTDPDGNHYRFIRHHDGWTSSTGRVNLMLRDDQIYEHITRFGRRKRICGLRNRRKRWNLNV